jgi:hypothetical protein
MVYAAAARDASSIFLIVRGKNHDFDHGITNISEGTFFVKTEGGQE